MYIREEDSTSQQTFNMDSPRMILSLAVVFSLVLGLTDGRPRAKRQTTSSSGCQNRNIDNDMGMIQIGNGQNYNNNEQCCFTFSPQMLVDEPFEVELHFEYFDVELHDQCIYDYVSYEGSNGQVDKDCGNRTGDKNFRSTGWFKICFHSDESVTGRGVKFDYFIYPAIPEDFDFSTPGMPFGNFTVEPTRRSNFTFPDHNVTSWTTSSPNFTFPDHNATSWTTSSPNFTFPDHNVTYWTTSSPNFTIPDHNVTSWTTSSPNFTFPDHNVTYWTTIPSNFTFPDHNVTVLPTMPSNNTCNRHLSGLRGHFSSPGYNQSYPNRQDCNTTIAGPSRNYTLSVTFRAFDIEGANRCQYDYLQLVWSTNQTEKACGHQWRNTTLHFNITGGNVNAVFHSDGSVTRGGFHATYVITVHAPPATRAPNTTVLPTTAMPSTPGYRGCSFTTNDTAGEYTLRTGRNGEYSSNEYCSINLEAPSLPHDTVLNFTHFDVEYHERCTYDSLDVIQGSRVVDKLCGSLDPFSKTYNNSGNLRLTFTSDYSVQKTGFSFKYRHQIKYCNATINGTSGSFATPPGGYMNNEVCFYTILTPHPVQLDFRFSRFDIEDASRCQYDSLTMGEDKLCGTSVQNKSYPSNGRFVMKLRTDGSVRRDGFHMSFTSTPRA